MNSTIIKKRFFAGALAASVALCVGAQTFLEDVNRDGEVDLQDMNRIINVILGNQPPTP